MVCSCCLPRRERTAMRGYSRGATAGANVYPSKSDERLDERVELVNARSDYSSSERSIHAVCSWTVRRCVRRSAVGSSPALSAMGKMLRAVRATAS